MKISGVKYHIDFISNNSLQFTSNVITKCVGWIYYKMLHPILHKAHVITKCVVITKCCRTWFSYSLAELCCKWSQPIERTFFPVCSQQWKKVPFSLLFFQYKAQYGGFIFDCFCNEIFVFIIKSRLWNMRRQLSSF